MSEWSRAYPVRFGDIDHAGVMYYPRMFDRIHRAFEDFWGDVTGRSYAGVLDGDGIGFPLVDVHAKFRKPFRFGEQLRVWIAVRRIGRKSITFRIRLTQDGAPSDDWSAEAELVTGVIAMGAFEPTPLPDLHRGLLQPYVLPG